MTQKPSRREFLRQTSALAIAGSAAPFALNLASIGAASAQVAGGYKALVCVFLYGGNDAHNTVVPVSGGAYNTYAATRGSLAWQPAELTPLSTILPGALQLGLPNELAPLATLYEAQQCAVVANVGPLIVPTNRTSFLAKSVPLPAKLFSHNDQQSTWQASAPEGAVYGWGGRIGDLLAAQNGNSTFTTINLTGNAVFLSGQQIQPYQLDPTVGAIPFNGVVGNNLYGSGAGNSALRTILTRTHASLMQNELGKVNQRSLDSQAILSTALAAPITPAPPALPANNLLAQQLQMVARVINARSALSAARQVFLVSMGGYDTHANQDATHPGLLTQLADAISWWQTTINQMGIASDVTLFTASDFGRALAPNSEGSDHGWGSHHFVVGGAVLGRQVYGSFPDLTSNSSTDAGNGRLIPTTSVEQYAATMAKWMGVTPANLPVILPNLVNFSQQDLGFMT